MSNEIVIYFNDLFLFNFNDFNFFIDNYWDILVGFFNENFYIEYFLCKMILLFYFLMYLFFECIYIIL